VPGLFNLKRRATGALCAVVSGERETSSPTAISRGTMRREKVADAQPASSNSDLVVRLQVLADLRAAGSLNDQEFTAAKAKLLS
jgi:hypothetical protein